MCLVPPECNEEVKRKESHTLWRKRGEAYWPYSKKREGIPLRSPLQFFLSAEKAQKEYQTIIITEGSSRQKAMQYENMGEMADCGQFGGRRNRAERSRWTLKNFQKITPNSVVQFWGEN
jgi:hypothetical protein